MNNGIDAGETVTFVIFCIVIFLMAGWGFPLLISQYSPNDIPANTTGCGIALSANLSLQYTTEKMMLLGKIWVPVKNVHRFYDLVCSNGTTIPGYQGG